MVRHEYVGREKESPACANPHNSARQRLEISLRQLRPNTQQVAGDEEGFSGHLQSAQTRHDLSVAQGFPETRADYPETPSGRGSRVFKRRSAPRRDGANFNPAVLPFVSVRGFQKKRQTTLKSRRA